MSKQRYVYGCDGGTIMIGNASSRVCIPNGYGDGSHCVYVYGINDVFKSDNYEFMGAVQGNELNVYDYDCLHGAELSDPSRILCRLEDGRYAIYVNEGTVVLKQWD